MPRFIKLVTFQNNPCYLKVFLSLIFFFLDLHADVFASFYLYWQFLLQCAEQLPHKIPLYATLVGESALSNSP